MHRLFLSYAREDRDAVQKLYLSFKASGLYPWMDEPPYPYGSEGIPPGAKWDEYVRAQLRDAEITLAFLSRRSIAKRGYVQREFRLALDIAMERPAASASLVPVLLEECDPPEIRVDTLSLSQLHWYKLYELGEERLTDYLIRLTSGSRDTKTRVDKSERIVELQNTVELLRGALATRDNDLQRIRGELEALRTELRGLVGRTIDAGEFTDTIDSLQEQIVEGHNVQDVDLSLLDIVRKDFGRSGD